MSSHDFKVKYELGSLTREDLVSPRNHVRWNAEFLMALFGVKTISREHFSHILRRLYRTERYPFQQLCQLWPLRLKSQTRWPFFVEELPELLERKLRERANDQKRRTGKADKHKSEKAGTKAGSEAGSEAEHHQKRHADLHKTQTGDGQRIAAKSKAAETADVPSALRPYTPLDECTTQALWNATSQTLRKLLRIDDPNVNVLVESILKGIESGKLRQWNGKLEESEWPFVPGPQILTGHSFGLPEALDIDLLHCIGERTLIDQQVRFSKFRTPVDDDTPFLLCKSLTKGSPDDVLIAFDVSLGIKCPLPPEVTLDDTIYRKDTEHIHKANMTPKYSFFDLHIDDGLHVLSVNDSTCIKLWVIYPPSEENLEVFARDCLQDGILGKFCREGKGGLWFIQRPGQAIHLPAGTLHAVFTINSGCLAGTTWASNTSLLPSALFFRLEYQRKPEDSVDAFRTLLQSLHCAVTMTEAHEDIAKALKVICELDMKRLWKLLKQDMDALVEDITIKMESAQLGDGASLCNCSRGIVEHITDPKRQSERPKRSKRRT